MTTPLSNSNYPRGAALLLLGLAFGSFPYILCALFLLGAAFSARGLRAPKLDASEREHA